MAHRSLSWYGGTPCHGQDGAKLAYQTSTSHTQTNGFTSNPRRSLRLKKITVIYEAESAMPVNLSSKHQQEIGTDTRTSSPNQSKSERPLQDDNHGPSMHKSDDVDIIDSDDESSTSITLMDLLTRSKVKKRKASEVHEHSNVDIQVHNNGLKTPTEDEIELEKTISSLKVKKAKSSPTSEKLSKHAEPALHSSPVEKRTVLTFPLVSASPESGLDETALKETISDELSVASEFGPRHKKESFDGKQKEFAEQIPLPVGSPTASVIKNEVIETCLDGSDDENSMMNSSTVLTNKCHFDNEYLGEVLNDVSEKEDLEQPDNVVSKIKDPFLIDIIKQFNHDFSSSSPPRLENCKITSHDVLNAKNEHPVVCSTKCGNDVGSSSMLNHDKCLPTEEIQKDDRQELQFEESMMFDKRDAHLIAAENSKEFFESDSKKFTRFLENDRWLVRNRKDNFSDNRRMVSLVSEFNSSYNCDNLGGLIDDSGFSLSPENHDNFVDGLNHGIIDESNCSGAIHSCKSLEIGSDGKYNMVNEICSEVTSQTMQALSSCSLSQMDHSILSSDTLISVDAPCSITETGSSYVNPVCEDARQASHYGGDSIGDLMPTDYLIDGNGWDSQIDKLFSSQVRMLNRCSERRPCAKVSDLTNDGLSNSVSSMDTIADLPTSSSLESSTQSYVGRQIDMQTIENLAADANKFGGDLCSGVEHSPKKLLSNRKEISPNSQEMLLRALNNGGLDDVVKLSNCMKKLCFDRGAVKKPLPSVLVNGEAFLEAEPAIKKPKTMNHSLPEATKGILKSPDAICCNPCCSKSSSICAQTHDAILFSQRQMQDTENIATKLLKGLSSLKSIVEETLFSEGPASSPSKLNFDEIRLATKQASKLEATTKKWLAMMTKDCTRFCKIMRLAENKLASPVSDLHKGRKKISFADEAGGALCQINVYEQQPVAFIFPKS